MIPLEVTIMNYNLSLLDFCHNMIICRADKQYNVM